MSLLGTHVLVLGLGESGLAMARWCARQGAELRVADSRAAPPGVELTERFGRLLDEPFIPSSLRA